MPNVPREFPESLEPESEPAVEKGEEQAGPLLMAALVLSLMASGGAIVWIAWDCAFR